METDDRRRMRHPTIALVAALAALAAPALVPAAAQAIPGGDGCDFPAIENTTENNDTSCAGDLEDVTGVETEGSLPALPPEVEDDSDPVTIKRCPRVAGTRSIRADTVDCETARSLARRAGRRRQNFEALGFKCEPAGRKVTCFRQAVESTEDDEDGQDAGQVVIVRRGEFLPRKCRRSRVC